MKDIIRFLLVHPYSGRKRRLEGKRRSTERFFQYSVLPSLYVAAAAPEYVKTCIVDEDVETLDFDVDVDIVGLSFMTMNAPRAYEIAARFRSRGIPVVAGGYHPTLCPEDAARYVDSVCVGEAESAIPELMEDLRSGTLKKVYRPAPPDLSCLPSPDRSQVSRAAYLPFDAIQATRGCPHRCTYCTVTAFHEHVYRRRPVDQVIDEVKHLRRQLFFVDDNLMADREYALELFAALAPLGRRWFGQCSTQVALDAEMLQAAADSGCRGLFVGFESLSTANLRAFRKVFNRPRQYAEAIRNLHRHGISAFAGIVFGMDDDDPSIFRETLHFLTESRVDFAAANILTPFPGTPLYLQMEQENRIRDRDWSHYDFNHVVFEPRQMSGETLLQGAAWVKAQFYSQGAIARRLARSFGYLDLGTVFSAVAPVNFGLRSRMSRSGTLALGRAADPA